MRYIEEIRYISSAFVDLTAILGQGSPAQNMAKYATRLITGSCVAQMVPGETTHVPEFGY